MVAMAKRCRTAAIEEVKKGSLEWMGSHREARGINNQS